MSNKELLYAASTLWVVVAAVLVMFMQAGFAFLEAGLTRMKNVGHVAAKNVLTGGELWVHDAGGRLLKRLNTALVAAERPDAAELETMHALVARHLRATDSGRAAELLAEWTTEVSRWWRVTPRAAVNVDLAPDEVAREVATVAV